MPLIACVSDQPSDDELVTLSPGVSPKHQQAAMIGYRVPTAKPKPKPSSARAPHGKASSSGGPVAAYRGPVSDRPKSKSKRAKRRKPRQPHQLKDADSVVISPIREAQPIP